MGTKVQSKNITIRAFKIINRSFSDADSGILNVLIRVLSQESTALSRRMVLNQEEPDIDLLANYSWSSNNTFLFGMMMRVISAESGGLISDKLFEQPTITMAQLVQGGSDQSQYKDHYYFALNNEYLVTNMQGNFTINRLQTYLNWLTESERGDRLFEFSEVVQIPNGVELAKIKEIQFVGGCSFSGSLTSNYRSDSLSVKLAHITKDVLRAVLSDTDSIESIDNNQLVDARLLLKVKGKPRGMDQREFQRVMGAIATNITNDSGLLLRTKDGNKFDGKAIKVKKSVSVDCVGANRIVEEQLKQFMQSFLIELRSLGNG